MFVRAYDKINGLYYKSIVYGTVNEGYGKKAILLNPRTDLFELVDFLDKTEKFPKPLYEIIDHDESGWAVFENHRIPRKHLLGHDTEIALFFGYPDVLADTDFMGELLCRGAVPREKAKFQLRGHADADAWTYIESEADAEAFLEQFAYFHDATIERMVYEESYTGTKLSVIFDNHCWFGVAELCFEGILAMNLRPPMSYYGRELAEGSLLLNEDGSVFWADSAMEVENLNTEGNFIRALNVKWRKLEDEE